MGDRGVEGLGGLAREVATAEVNGGERDYDRNPGGALLEDGLDGVERGFGVQRVEDGFDQEDVGAAVEQSVDRLGVGRDHIVERYVAVAGVVYVRGDGERLVCGAYASGDEAGLAGVGVGVLVGYAARQLRGFAVYLVHPVFEAELRQAVACGGEGVGGEDVGAGVEVLALNVADDARLGENQRVHAALQVEMVVGEALASELRFRQPVGLEHDSPGAVHDHDAALQYPLYVGGSVNDGRGRVGAGRRGHGATSSGLKVAATLGIVVHPTGRIPNGERKLRTDFRNYRKKA